MRSAKAFMLSWFALLAILPSLTHPSPVEVNEDDNDHFIDHPMDPDLFEGDIIQPKHSRSAMHWESGKWDEGIVPYEIAESLQNVVMIEEAIKELNNVGTCIQFVRRTNQRDYIKFRRHEKRGCSSGVGKDYRGGEQHINVNPEHCGQATILHEMMHAIGFYHEQSRPDRDSYVKYNENNVEPKYRNNFEKRNNSLTHDLPYDYCSIMHYTATLWSKDPSTLNSIEVLGNVNVMDLCNHELGRAQHLSKLDIEGVNRLYKCPNQPTQPTTTRSTAPSVTNPIEEPRWVTGCGDINRMAELYGDYSRQMIYDTESYIEGPDENGIYTRISSHVYCAGGPRKTNRSYEEGVTICKQSFRKGLCPFYLHAGNVMFRCGYEYNCSNNKDKK